MSIIFGARGFVFIFVAQVLSCAGCYGFARTMHSPHLFPFRLPQIGNRVSSTSWSVQAISSSFAVCVEKATCSRLHVIGCERCIITACDVAHSHDKNVNERAVLDASGRSVFRVFLGVSSVCSFLISRSILFHMISFFQMLIL